MQPVVYIGCPQFCVCGYPIATGAAARLVLGYDSYGNTCGWNNSKIEGVPLSGLDMREKKFVQFSPFLFTSISFFAWYY